MSKSKSTIKFSPNLDSLLREYHKKAVELARLERAIFKESLPLFKNGTINDLQKYAPLFHGVPNVSKRIYHQIQFIMDNEIDNS